MFGCRILRIDSSALADAIAPSAGVALALVRGGCFLSGCCFGKETTLPWGGVFPIGSPAHVHQISKSLEMMFESPHPVAPHSTL